MEKDSQFSTINNERPISVGKGFRICLRDLCSKENKLGGTIRLVVVCVVGNVVMQHDSIDVVLCYDVLSIDPHGKAKALHTKICTTSILVRRVVERILILLSKHWDVANICGRLFTF